MKQLILAMAAVASLHANADVFAFRHTQEGAGVSVCFKTSYISFLLQQNVYVPTLTDDMTEQLLSIGALATDPEGRKDFAGRILEISFDATTLRARIRVIPIDSVGPVVVRGEPFMVEVPFDAAKRVFLAPLASAKDN